MEYWHKKVLYVVAFRVNTAVLSRASTACTFASLTPAVSATLISAAQFAPSFLPRKSATGRHKSSHSSSAAQLLSTSLQMPAGGEALTAEAEEVVAEAVVEEGGLATAWSASTAGLVALAEEAAGAEGVVEGVVATAWSASAAGPVALPEEAVAACAWSESVPAVTSSGHLAAHSAACAPAATAPAATAPAATAPAATAPAVTAPAVTDPAVTDPAAHVPAAFLGARRKMDKARCMRHVAGVSMIRMCKVQVSRYTHTHTHTHTHMHACMHACMESHMCMHACVRMCVCVCVCAYV